MKTRIVCLIAFALLHGHACAEAPAPKTADQRKNFKETDIDKDNRVSRNEWRYRSDVMFKKIDVNADGFLSFEEIKWYHGNKNPSADKAVKPKERPAKPVEYVDPNVVEKPKPSLRDRLGNMIEGEDEDTK